MTTAALVVYPQCLRYHGVSEDLLLIGHDLTSLLIVKLSSDAKFQDVRMQRSVPSEAPL